MLVLAVIGVAAIIIALLSPEAETDAGDEAELAAWIRQRLDTLQ